MSDPLRILHVTEAASAGVLHSVSLLGRLQAATGADVTFLYVPRRDTPPSEELDKLMGGVDRRPRGSADDGLLARIRTLRSEVLRATRAEHFDVVHAHSSLAGAAVRLAIRPGALSCPVFYSPHGFSFLRTDVNAAIRTMFQWAERIAARGGTVVAASQSEQDVAVRALHPARTRVLTNGVDFDSLPPPSRVPKARPVIAMLGRVTYQKAPWRFAEVARALSEKAEFLWIGDGDIESIRKWLGDAPIRLTGWLSQDEVLAQLCGVDLVCFPTLWEGLPMSLINAQAMGIPVVASRVVGNVDVIEHGVTGFLVEDDSTLVEMTSLLIDDLELRSRMGVAASTLARGRFDAREVAKLSIELYRQAVREDW